MEQTQILSDEKIQTQSGRFYFILVIATIIVICLIVGFSTGLLALVNSQGALNPFTHLLPLPALTVIFTLIALQINMTHARHIVGWLLLIVGFFLALTFVSASYIEFERYVLKDTGNLLSNWMNWLNCWIWFIPSTLPLNLVLMYFPDGRLPSPRWRAISAITIVGLVMATFAFAFHPDSLPDDALLDANPFALTMFVPQLELLMTASMIVLGPCTLAAFASIVMRYRRATGIARIQLKWLVYSVGCVLAMMMVWGVFLILQPDSKFINEIGIALMLSGMALIISSIGIAILKHHLWNIDLFINKTLVYGILSLLTISIYFIVVTFLSTLFDGDNLLFSLVATGLVAVSFQTMRDHIQRLINRLMFGYRDEPYIVLDRLSQQLEPVVMVDDILPTIVRTVAQALRLPYVAISLKYEGNYKVVAMFEEDGTNTQNISRTILPLVYQSETIGQLKLAPRGQSDAFTPTDLKLLETIARQASVAAYNVRLTIDLQHSREELVTTREEERRRLRRDLHDGLGPVLAAMSFRLDAIRNLVDHDSEAAKTVATELKAQVQSSLTEIRRIAYDLRPPALDELGLLGALREHLNALESSDSLEIIFNAPQQISTLAAAVEVAAYRITLEALTNVQRHAHASRCEVSLNLTDDDLQINIIDNGQGIEDNYRAGVGLNAMRERAEELGGQCTISKLTTGGTLVSAVLPLFKTV